MMEPSCPNYEIFKTMESSLDRLEEAAWFIRLIEEHYHEADRFRWSLNSFLRTLKEVLQLVTMEVQANEDIRKWLNEEKVRLSEDPQVGFLYKQRDIVVHKSMLKPTSRGMVGFTRGRGLKLGIGIPIDPLEDSQIAILRYINHAAKERDFWESCIWKMTVVENLLVFNANGV